MMSTRIDNIIVCYTPLHVLQAIRIIDLEGLKNVFSIYFFTEDNDKARNYSKQLREKSSIFRYEKKTNKLIATVLTLSKLWFYILNKEFGRISFYTGNIKTIYSRFFIFSLALRNLITFDDGMGNICGEGYFYKDLNTLFYRLAGNNFPLLVTYNQIYHNVKYHYTIYNSDNVFNRVKYLKLFNIDTTSITNLSGSSTSILLLSTLSEDFYMTLDEEVLLYSYIIDRFKVDFYIEHPLNKFVKIHTYLPRKLVDNRISEDIILELLNNYAMITVIGIYSSALIHLAQSPRINCINIEANLGSDFSSTKKLFISNKVSSFVID